MITRDQLLEPVNFLATEASAPRHYDALKQSLRVASLPIKFTGELAVLNPLLDLYREDKQMFQRVIDLIDGKRTARGLDPLQATPTDFDRNEYQREFMHQKRARERRVAEIENLSRPERDKLIGTARIEFIRRRSNQWKKRRDEALKAARLDNGGALTKEQMNALLERFWEQIDAELDAAEADAERKIRGW